MVGQLRACSTLFDSWLISLARSLHIGIGRLKLIIAGLVIIGLVVMSAAQISGGGIEKDAVVNLRFAHNLSQHGVLSTAESAPYLPSNAREPIPNIVTSLHLRILSHLQPDLSFSELVNGDGARAVKLVNLFWVVLGLVATCLLINAFTDSFLLVLLTTALVGYFFFAVKFVDTLYTELQAGVVMLWASWFLLLAVTSGRKVHYLLVGLSFGLLSLTKAIFFYVCLAITAFFLLRSFWITRSVGKGPAPMRALAMLAGFALAVMPWMVRNKLQLDTLQLTQRGGRVMYARAIKNMMKNEEIPGAIYFWGPSFYQYPMRMLGFVKVPEDFNAGGRYQRINRERSDFQKSDLKAALAGRPEDVISYRYKMVADINRLTYQAVARGLPDPVRYAEKQGGEKAKRMILSHPLRHIAMTPLFLWRGIWSWSHEGVLFRGSRPYILFKDVLSLITYLSLFILFFLGARFRNPRFLAITVLPVCMLLAYGFLTHNLPRYSAPAIPLMILSMVVLLERSTQNQSRNVPL